MKARGPIVTLLTDFGLEDYYVGVMKGVIWGLNPQVLLVDLCHRVPAQDLKAAAFLLEASWSYFPAGTIHVAVVDPGVGTARRLLAARLAGHYFLAPDNGLLSWIFAVQAPEQVVSLENAAYWRPQPAATFHGRDILAPVAGHLSLGVPLRNFGPPLQEWGRLSRPQPQWGEDAALGEIIYIDHFGNLVTNIKGAALESWRRGRPVQLTLGQRLINRFGYTYEEAGPGELLALVGSHGYLEVAANRGSAAELLDLSIGSPVRIQVLKS